MFSVLTGDVDDHLPRRAVLGDIDLYHPLLVLADVAHLQLGDVGLVVVNLEAVAATGSSMVTVVFASS